MYIAELIVVVQFILDSLNEKAKNMDGSPQCLSLSQGFNASRQADK